MNIKGRLFALPNAREFEIHRENGQVIYGRIAPDFTVDQIQQFNGTQTPCIATISGEWNQIPTLIGVAAA